MEEVVSQLSTIGALMTPAAISLIWLVRLEGKVNLNQQRIDDQATNMNIMMDTIKEMRKELQTLNSNVMWMRGRLQGEQHMTDHQE